LRHWCHWYEPSSRDLFPAWTRFAQEKLLTNGCFWKYFCPMA
jgi:hypothetical protein